MSTPKTREALISSELPDQAIIEIIQHLRARVEKYGDVQAARLLLEFRFGKSPEPPQEGSSLEQILMQTPLGNGQTDTM